MLIAASHERTVAAIFVDLRGSTGLPTGGCRMMRCISSIVTPRRSATQLPRRVARSPVSPAMASPPSSTPTAHPPRHAVRRHARSRCCGGRSMRWPRT